MPIPGIFASAISGNLYGSFESLATTIVGAGGATIITFADIPTTYQHLQIRCLFNNSNISTSMRFNGDTATNYSDHILYGDGATAAAAGVANKPSITFTQYSSAGSNIFYASIIDILDYSNTNKYKTVRSLHGADTNGAGTSAVSSGSWRSNSAITSITFGVAGGAWTQNSQVALYGIKGVA